MDCTKLGKIFILGIHGFMAPSDMQIKQIYYFTCFTQSNISSRMGANICLVEQMVLKRREMLMAKKKNKEITIRSSAAEYLTYVAAVGDNANSMEMRYENENIWLTQKMMAALYDVDVRTISEHLKNIYSDDELTETATIRNFRIVQTEGSRQVNREIIHYNLQAIIAVGFKVNNDRAVRFRKWAGQIVKDYTIQGWTDVRGEVMNSEIVMYQTDDGLTKIETTFDNDTVWLSIDQMADLFQRDKSTISRHIKNIFDEGELIRNSVVAKFATTAADGKTYQVDYYNLDVIISVGYRVKSLRGTQFRIWASSVLKEYMKKGLVYYSVDADKPYMGMRSFKGEIPTQGDALVAKSYCTEEELSALNSVVSAYLEFADMQARRRIPMYMADWIETLDGFLKLSKHEILTHAGKISAKAAELKAKDEYKKYKTLHLADASKAEKDYIKALEDMEMKLLGEMK